MHNSLETEGQLDPAGGDGADEDSLVRPVEDEDDMHEDIHEDVHAYIHGSADDVSRRWACINAY